MLCGGVSGLSRGATANSLPDWYHWYSFMDFRLLAHVNQSAGWFKTRSNFPYSSSNRSPISLTQRNSNGYLTTYYTSTTQQGISKLTITILVECIFQNCAHQSEFLSQIKSIAGTFKSRIYFLKNIKSPTLGAIKEVSIFSSII